MFIDPTKACIPSAMSNLAWTRRFFCLCNLDARTGRSVRSDAKVSKMSHSLIPCLPPAQHMDLDANDRLAAAMWDRESSAGRSTYLGC